jgi:hypothetical protein
MGTYKTRRIGFASFLRYLGVPHVKTVRLFEKAYEFYFDDPDGHCRTFEKQFYEGASVADAWMMLERDREIKQTMKDASLTGVWESN